MDTLQAIILGIVQGIAEFLPISSSGHLQIAKAVMGVEIEENLIFDVTLHAATVLSTIVVLRREIWALISSLFSKKFNENHAYVLKLIVSMIPIAIVGFTVKDHLDVMLSTPYILLIVGAMLLLTAALLAFTSQAKPQPKSDISYRDAFVIGLAQSVAVMPGLSRSGSTIATGILLGNDKAKVAQFSFLMVLAPILGDLLLTALSGELSQSAASIGFVQLTAGFVSAFVVGALACKFMLEIVRRGKLVWFAIYCGLAGLVSIGSYFLG